MINVIKTGLKFVLVLFHLLTIRHIFPHAAGSVLGLSYTLLTAIEIEAIDMTLLSYLFLLDLNLSVTNGFVSSKIYDKRDD